MEKEIGTRWPQAKEILEPLEPQEVGTITLESLWEVQPCQHCFQTSGLENGEKISGCYLKRQVLGNSFFQETKTPTEEDLLKMPHYKSCYFGMTYQ